MFFFSNAGGLQLRIFGFSKKKDPKNNVFLEYSEIVGSLSWKGL